MKIAEWEREGDSMNDAELLAEHIRAIEFLLQHGTLTDADRTVTRARLMVIVGKLRQPQPQDRINNLEGK